MPDELRVELDASSPGPVRLTVSGEVDTGNAAVFREWLERAAADGRPVVVDVDGMTYLDSAGVAALFALARRVALELVASPTCRIRRVLEVVAIDQVATVRPA